MLNKEACSKCRGKHEFLLADVNDTMWTDWVCPEKPFFDIDHGIISETDNPPNNCGYMLEHAISQSVGTDREGVSIE